MQILLVNKPVVFFALLLTPMLLSLGCSDANAAHDPLYKTGASAVGEPKLVKQDWLTDSVHFYQRDSTISYVDMKVLIMKEKRSLYSTDASMDSISSWFCHRLVHGIIPYWYGTPWTFEGYTAVPGQGTVACGYFVSTTLQHMGLNVNRYKMAQQLPIHEALTLAIDSNQLITVEESTTEAIIAQLDTMLLNGLYFLGFDQSHVGFLLRENNQLFVIHSNYIGAQGVTVERIQESQAFAGYLRFYVAPISGNKKLMEKWLLNEVITVIETP
ncbi:MAG: hypothetical protein HYZ14_18810 [Bacteroidetes bacterium]|nr:hypothetical protein [Bacteroidota bacterium]